MKHHLSFCDIEQLSEKVFEVTVAEGITLDNNHIKIFSIFFLGLRKKPFNILLNDKNSFRISFSGSIEIGRNHLINQIAILNNCPERKVRLDVALEIKNSGGRFSEDKVFSDRIEALNWLNED